MKFPFSADEIQRGLIILALAVVLGMILGVVQWCSTLPSGPQVVLPSYNPFEEGLSPETVRVPSYSDFRFNFPGLPRFLPKWKTILKQEDALSPETFEEEWQKLGDPLMDYPSDAAIEKALDDLILGR